MVTVAASSSKAVVLGSHLGGRGIGHTVDELGAVGTAQGCQGSVGKGGPVSQDPIPHDRSPVLYLKAAASPNACGKAVAHPGASLSPRRHSVFQL